MNALSHGSAPATEAGAGRCDPAGVGDSSGTPSTPSNRSEGSRSPALGGSIEPDRARASGGRGSRARGVDGQSFKAIVFKRFWMSGYPVTSKSGFPETLNL